MVAPRIGPWCHGEVRNGGFPDWVQNKGIPMRTNSTAWLALVRTWYTGLAAQMKGRYWADGGAVISLQLDNETPDVDYLLALRALAVELGMAPWFFVKTGWPSPDKTVEPGQLFPVSGGYYDEFWTDSDNSTGGFLFGAAANTTIPTITAEAGPGMASSYHRRLFIDPVDAAAAIQVFLANGVTQLGMYMYHGGSDPIGNLSTMQEQQGLGEGGANDMPCVSYDFQAPIGECGQTRTHYHSIRRLSLAARLHAPLLALASTFVPSATPSSPLDTATLRWAARGDGSSALVFLNTVQTFATMQPQTGLRLSVRLAGGAAVALPANGSAPLDVPAGAAPVWAVRTLLPLGLRLEYATAAPLGVVSDGAGGSVVLFGAVDGVRAEIAFAAAGAAVSCAAPARCEAEGALTVVRGIVPVAAGAAPLQPQAGFSVGGARASLLVLDGATAARVWRAPGREGAVFISDAATGLVAAAPGGGGAGAAVVLLESTGLGAPARLWACPPPASIAPADHEVPLAPTADGVCAFVDVPLPAPGVTASVAAVAAAGAPRVIPKGKSGRAQAPARDGTLGEFAAAAVYNVSFAGAPAAGVDVRLEVSYNGDSARVYAAGGGTAPGDLLFDHFYQGQTFNLPLTRSGRVDVSGSAPPLQLRVLPQGPRDVGAPVYFEAPPQEGAAVLGVTVVETASVTLDVKW